MQNKIDNASVGYMLRYFITANVTDPLNAEDRGTATYIQYFSGDNTAGQINYLEFKPVSSTSTFRVWVYTGGAWVLQEEDTDYTLDRTNMKITWISTPASGNDNIKVEYMHIKGWVYDDMPIYSGSGFPRISVEDVSTEVENKFLGVPANFVNSIGDFHRAVFAVGVFAKKGMSVTIANKNYKNRDIVRYLAQQIKTKIHTNRVPIFWKFFDMKVTNMERIKSDEDAGIYRYSLTVQVTYWDNGQGG